MKKIGILGSLLVLSLVVMVGTCLAAAAATVPAAASGFSQIVDNTVQPVLVSLIGAMLPLLIAFGCRYLTKLTGVTVSQASQQQLEGIAEKSVLAVEEKATASLKNAGEKWTGYQKHKEAIDNILALAPSLSHDQADMLVHWAIAKIPGLGSTGVLGAASAPSINITNLSPGGTDASAAEFAGSPAAAAL